jgi:hypothetical protein
MQIAGINTYTGLGNSVIGNHIDFISKELWNTIHCFNKVDYNNGNDYTSSSFLASDLNYWLNSMSGSVPNSTTDYTEKVSVDYTSDGVLYYFPTRFSSSKILTKDNNYSWGNSKKLWIPSEIEVYGCPMWGDSNYGACGFIQYPLFSCNANRVKKRCVGKDAYAWWLLSTASNSSSQMCLVTGSGVCSCYNTTYNIPVPICFRIDDTGSLIT